MNDWNDLDFFVRTNTKKRIKNSYISIHKNKQFMLSSGFFNLLKSKNITTEELYIKLAFSKQNNCILLNVTTEKNVKINSNKSGAAILSGGSFLTHYELDINFIYGKYLPTFEIINGEEYCIIDLNNKINSQKDEIQ